MARENAVVSVPLLLLIGSCLISALEAPDCPPGCSTCLTSTTLPSGSTGIYDAMYRQILFDCVFGPPSHYSYNPPTVAYIPECVLCMGAGTYVAEVYDLYMPDVRGPMNITIRGEGVGVTVFDLSYEYGFVFLADAPTNLTVENMSVTKVGFSTGSGLLLSDPECAVVFRNMHFGDFAPAVDTDIALAFYVWRGLGLTLEGCVVSGIGSVFDDYSVVMYVDPGTPCPVSVYNTTIRDVVCEGSCIVYLNGASSFFFHGSTFENITSRAPEAIASLFGTSLSGTGTFTFDGCLFQDNSVAASLVRGRSTSTITFTNSVFIHNRIYNESVEDFTSGNRRIAALTCNSDDSEVPANLVARNCLVADNNLTAFHFHYTCDSVELTDNTFINNYNGALMRGSLPFDGSVVVSNLLTCSNRDGNVEIENGDVPDLIDPDLTFSGDCSEVCVDLAAQFLTPYLITPPVCSVLFDYAPDCVQDWTGCPLLPAGSVCATDDQCASEVCSDEDLCSAVSDPVVSTSSSPPATLSAFQELIMLIGIIVASICIACCALLAVTLTAWRVRSHSAKARSASATPTSLTAQTEEHTRVINTRSPSLTPQSQRASLPPPSSVFSSMNSSGGEETSGYTTQIVPGPIGTQRGSIAASNIASGHSSMASLGSGKANMASLGSGKANVAASNVGSVKSSNVGSVKRTPVERPSSTPVGRGTSMSRPSFDSGSAGGGGGGGGEELQGVDDVKVLGRGGQAIVYSAFSYSLGQKVCIKVFFDDASFAREADILSFIPPHRNVVAVFPQLTGVPCPRSLVMALATRGTLADYLSAQPLSGRPKDAARVACHIAAGLQHLHTVGVCHLDVKPANILVTTSDSDGSQLFMLADFGSAFVQGRADLRVSMCTVRYAAPEVRALVNGKTLSESGLQSYTGLDVYCFGVTLWEMCTGREPLSGMSSAQILSGSSRVDPSVVSHAGLASIVELCTRAGDERPRLFDLVLSRLEEIRDS